MTGAVVIVKLVVTGQSDPYLMSIFGVFVSTAVVRGTQSAAERSALSERITKDLDKLEGKP